MSDVQEKSLKPTLLIVDDENDIRYTLNLLFQSVGVNCISAADGESALELVQQYHPIDAIISDINMPNMDGIEFLEKMRQVGIYIPLVFLSGRASKQDAVRALQLGAHDFIEKPYEVMKLKASVLSALDVGVALRDYKDELRRIACDSNNRHRDKMIALLLMKVRKCEKKASGQ